MLNITFANIMQRQTLLGKFIIWRVKHIGNRQFIIFLSIIIGLAGGLAAVIIKNSVHLIQLLPLSILFLTY